MVKKPTPEPTKQSFRDYFRKMDKVLLFTTILLVIIGTLSIVSASSRETVSRYDYSIYHFFERHLGVLGLSLVASIIILLIPTRYYKIIVPAGFILVGCLIFSLFLIDNIKRGSGAWLEQGGQPSEVAKPFIIAMLALIFDYYYKKMKKKQDFNWWSFFGLFCLIGLMLPVVTLVQGDMGTAILTVGISGIMLLSSPVSKDIKKNCIIGCLILSIAGCLGLYAVRGRVFTEEQVERLTEFINPCSKYEDSGYQICNGFIAMNDGGLTGLGIGKSRQKYSYIPDPHTDSIFAVVIEETGLLFGLFILFLYLLMISRILNASMRTKNIRNRYIAFGIAAYLFLHIVFNLGGLLAILPLTGVPLPLITYGGSFTLSFLCSLAVVQRICIESKV